MQLNFGIQILILITDYQLYLYRLPCRSHQSNSLPRKNFIIHYPQKVFVHNEGKKKLMG